MTMTGKQKAAMLLMGLDAVTAAELLKGLDHDTVKELAVELAYLETSGMRNHAQNLEVVSQFCSMLESNQGFHLKGFLNKMLKSTVGEEKAEEIQTQIGHLLHKRDPFMSIRTADAKTLAHVLSEEHPQAIAVVLSELPTKKSSEVLAGLEEGVRLSAVTRMAGAEAVTPEAKNRIAQVVSRRLETAISRGGGAGQEKALRKVAVMLRNLGQEVRDGMMKNINEQDKGIGEKISGLMIIWEDITQITDRSLQEVLRDIDSQKLALALMKADESMAKKIKSNISERAAAAIDEETSLMSAPKKSDIEAARQEVVAALRSMNEKGELNFIEE